MALITRQCIESLKIHINIFDVVSREVQLKRSGRNWVGLSPFQPEKTPSFYVLPDKGIFKCFSTGLAGDIFRFVEELEKLSFIEAVEVLAERFNQPLEYEKGGGPRPEERSHKRQLLELHEHAADFFHRAFLADNPDAAACREYWLGKRGFPLELAKEFKIGFAPVASQKLNERLIAKGFTDKALRDSGLFYAQDYDPDPLRFRNRFRGRLMIPIRDRQGQVIAFTARQLEITPADDPAREAKYINSPGTVLFQKSHLVFNLERAREAVRETASIVLVEGQLDAIRCWHEGFRHTIAPQGTSITPEQMKLLRPYTERLTVVLDGDSAGRKGALRMLPLALAAGLEVSFAALPAGDDPDSFLRTHGIDAFRALLDEAAPAMHFVAEALVPPEATPRDHANAVGELAQILKECDSEVARFAYFEQALDCLPLDREAAERDFRHHLNRLAARAPRRVLDATPPPAEPLRSAGLSSLKLTSSEAELALIVLHHEDLGVLLAEVLDPAWIDFTLPAGRILGWILGEFAEGHKLAELEPRGALEEASDRDLYFSFLADEPTPADPFDIVNAHLRILYKRHLDHQVKKIAAEIANLEGDFERQMKLQVELATLRRRRSSHTVPVLRATERCTE